MGWWRWGLSVWVNNGGNKKSNNISSVTKSEKRGWWLEQSKIQLFRNLVSCSLLSSPKGSLATFFQVNPSLYSFDRNDEHVVHSSFYFLHRRFSFRMRKEGIRCDLPLDSQLMTYFIIKEREREGEVLWVDFTFLPSNYVLSLSLTLLLSTFSLFLSTFVSSPCSSFTVIIISFLIIPFPSNRGIAICSLSLSLPSSLSPLIPLFSSETKHRSSSFQLVTTFSPFSLQNYLLITNSPDFSLDFHLILLDYKKHLSSSLFLNSPKERERRKRKCLSMKCMQNYDSR